MTCEFALLAAHDVSRVVELLAAALPLEDIAPAKFARHVLLDINYDPRGAIVARVEGHIAGFIYAAARTQPLNEQDATRGYVTVFAVEPKFARQGIATALIRSAEQYLQSRGRTQVLISPYAPYYFTPGVDVAAYPVAVTFLAKLGYVEISRPISMRADLTILNEPPFVSEMRRRLQSDGVAIEPFRVELTHSILQFARSQFGPDWEHVYRDAIHQILRGDLPSRIVVAHQENVILGISHHDGDRFGPIGVASAARHRGIGQVLMYETLSAQRAAGFATAFFLWSDDTTAARLYRSAGFIESRRFVMFRSELA